MNRRRFLSMTSAGVAAAGIPAAAAQTGETTNVDTPLRFIDEKTGRSPFRVSGGRAKRPNIFLISLDMVSPDFYHPSRPFHQYLNLPTIRGLSNDGVVFNNAFCTVPLCAPSRASYLTGRYTYILGNGERAPDGLETELRPDDIIFPEYLKAIGYNTQHSGKSHVGTKKFLDAFGENDTPWNRWSPPVYDDEDFLEYQRQLHVERQKYSREIVTLQADRKSPGNSLGGWIVQQNGRPFPLEAQYTYYLVERSINKLESVLASRGESEEPIYFQLDIFDPHQPLSVPDGFADRERELRGVVSLPESYKKVQSRDWGYFSDQPKIYDLYRKYWGLYNPQTLLDYRVAYALQMEVVDRSLARFVALLKQRGLYDESVIILISDHGEMDGRWALIDKGVYLYPDVLRVPLVVKMPASSGVKHHAVDSPASLLDLAPTILSLAGVEPQARMDGHSLVPLIEGTATPADRDLFFSCGWHVGANFACGHQRWSAGGEHYLYSYNLASNVDELYDLHSIDAENLARKPEYAKVRGDMIEEMGKMLQDEPRWLGYWASFRVDHTAELPRIPGDQQLFRTK